MNMNIYYSLQSLFIFVSITSERLLDVARKCRVRTIDGKLLFGSSIIGQDDFPSLENEEVTKLQDQLDNEEGRELVQKDARSLFTSADILWMIRHEIDNVRSETKQILQIGNLKMTLFQGQSIGKNPIFFNFVKPNLVNIILTLDFLTLIDSGEALTQEVNQQYVPFA